MNHFLKFSLLSLCLGASLLKGAGVEYVTLKKELPNKQTQFIHVINDFHFENILKLSPEISSLPALISTELYKKMCSQQRNQLAEAVNKIGAGKCLVLAEDPLTIGSVSLSNDFSLIQGLCDFCKNNNFKSHSVECRHQNFGVINTAISIPLGFMNDEIRKKIDALVLNYNDSPFLNAYYQKTHDNLLSNNQKVRESILETSNTLKQIFKEKGNTAFDIIFGPTDKSPMLEKIFTGDTEALKIDVLALTIQLNSFLKESGQDILNLLTLSMSEVEKHFKANMALAGLLDVQIMHNIYNNPQVQHIVVCSGAMHGRNILPLLESPEMGYTRVCSTDIGIDIKVIITYQIFEQIYQTFQSQLGIIGMLSRQAGNNFLTRLINMRPLANIFMGVLAKPSLVEEHFNKFMQIHPEIMQPISRL